MSKPDIVIDIPNFCTPGSGLCSGGKPQPESLQQAADHGIQVVINFCPPAENPGFDEAALVQQLGMQYVNIPISGPADLSWPAVQELAQAMDGANDSHRVLLHCASGNRAGAMLALKAFMVDKKPIPEALEIGRSAGLLTLEPVVEQLMRSAS